MCSSDLFFHIVRGQAIKGMGWCILGVDIAQKARGARSRKQLLNLFGVVGKTLMIYDYGYGGQPSQGNQSMNSVACNCSVCCALAKSRLD